NGGLFDPMNGYDWVNADLFLPDSLFSNTNATRQGDTGDGILDVFDRFNFTVKEDEPLEREVAIDPELLGKAYEKFNAIRSDNFDEFEKALKSGKKGDENKFNRQFGVFYTPRQFVHYMCRQALIRYLATELSGKGPGEDLETLVRMGEGISANEARVMKHARETRSYSHKLPQSVREHAEAIDACLAGITVCDPAVGSGAFPVGMMIEIVRARTVLSIFMENQDSRSAYDFKRHCIEYGLFGVDIDPGAVEIAKLRLWLSLIVDEEDPRHIKPLPNLDFKFVQGDFLQRIRRKEQMLHLLNEVNLEEAKKKYFNEADPRRKNEYREMINELLHQMTKGYTLFDFRIYFSEVFRHKGGFDVMIGNPPYIQLQKDGGRLARLYSGYDYKTFQRTGDIYTLFYENGIRMLKPGGHLCFITSSKWMKSEYGKSLRQFLCSYNPVLLIELGPGVFESATVDTNILLIQKDKNRNCLQGITLVKEARENSLDDFINAHKAFIPSPGEKVWFIGSQTQLNLREKIEGLGKPLKEWEVNIIRGVLTGYNKAFIVDQATRDRLVAEGPKSAEILRPVLRGRDIERYTYNWAGLWLIASGYDLDLPGQYPAVFAHLKQFEASARKRHDQGLHWWNLRACAYYSEFEQEKVVWIELADKGRFAYVEPGVYTEATTFLMTLSRPKYFVGCLNSRLINWYFSSICASSGMGTNRWKKIYVELLPVPPITPKNTETVGKIETLVDRIIDLKNDSQDTSRLENHIDQLVYRLYDLTPEEIGVVEASEQN
uniref:Eco57I restriction-modification methylase domain-containing protein n=1 Tax=Desulfonatronospira sp. TaxID=1962951 RepID=UPI0025BED3C1